MIKAFSNMTQEELCEMKDTIDQSIEDRNVVDIVEFSEYIPLFKPRDIEMMDEMQFVELSDKYVERFSLFHPVVVTTAVGKQAILFKLPPLFTQVPTLNNIGPDSVNVINAYSKALTFHKDPISLAPTKMSRLMEMCIEKSVALQSEEIKKNIMEFAEYMDNLRDGQVIKESDEETQASVDADEFLDWD